MIAEESDTEEDGKGLQTLSVVVLSGISALAVFS